MRVNSTLKNSLYAMVSYLLLAVLAIVVRRVFLNTLSVELLGYEGLFGNVFALLALADLGIENVILFRLFPAFAKDNKDEINRIMSVYRFLYRIIGFVVLFIGISLLPFLKFIIKDNNYNWSYVYVIFIIQLLMTITSYFLAYKRILFLVNQQEYECIKTDTAVSFVFTGVKLVTLLLLKSYIIYLLCGLGSNLIGNIIIAKKVDTRFDYCNNNNQTSLDDVRSLNIGKDIRNNIIQKVCGTIYGGTDNIVISALLGISYVGLLSNYLLISGHITAFLTKVLKPCQMSIGTYSYSSDQDEGARMFRMFDFISFVIATIVTCCYLCLFNPTIELLFGADYLLADGFVISFCVNQYIAWNHQFLTYYRYSFGRYELDRIPIIFAAVANVILSIVLSKPFGITGVMVGTIIGQIGFWIGRVYVVYTVYMKERVYYYALRQIVRLLVGVCEAFLVMSLCKVIQVSVLGIMLRVIIGVLIPLSINIVLFYKTSEMNSVVIYLKRIKSIVFQKGKIHS